MHLSSPRGSEDPPTTEDYLSFLEKAEKQAAGGAAEALLQRHEAVLLENWRNHPIDIEGLLSPEFAALSDLPAALHQEVASLHERFRNLIQLAATRIEQHNYKTAEQVLAGMDMGYTHRQEAHTLMQADKQVHISCRSMQVCMELFVLLNERVKARIEEAATSSAVHAETGLLLVNAVLVHELADFLIGYIENFYVDGIESLRKLYEGAKAENGRLRQNLSELKAKAQRSAGTPEHSRQILQNVGLREAAIARVEGEWDDYMKRIETAGSELGLLSKALLVDLDLTRHDAASQVRVINAIALLNIARSSLGALQSSISTFSKIRPVALSPERVGRLLGLATGAAEREVGP